MVTAIRTRWFMQMAGIACILCSGSSAHSLWGRKAVFRMGGYWQLAEGSTVPALDELSACVTLSRRLTSPKWTAFMYKLWGGSRAELGLAGGAGELRVWLFGEEWRARVDLSLTAWHTVCLTWSGRSRDLRLYVNGSSVLEARVNETEPCCLAPGGSLTLGASHGFVNGHIAVETGSSFVGEITLFRMWAGARGGQQLANHSCTEGDVVRWDARDWNTQGWPPEPDPGLQCAWSLYEIWMQLCIIHLDSNSSHANSTKDIVNHWLTSTFPSNISVITIFVSPSVREPHIRNHSPDVHNTEENQERRNVLKAPMKAWFESLVYVSVTPDADVSEAQAEISRLLSVTYSNEILTLNTEPNSTRVSPVEGLPLVTPLPPDSPGNTTAFAEVTSSASTALTAASAVAGTPAVTLPTATSSFRPSATASDPGHAWTDNGPTSPDIFYMVMLNVTVQSSSEDPAEAIHTWLQNTLEVERILVLNLALQSVALSPMSARSEQHALQKDKVCVHKPMFNITKTGEQITALLLKPYSNGTVRVLANPEEINITHIEPGWCPERIELTERGLYVWPKTEAQRLVREPCKGDPQKEATRLCEVNGMTGKATWAAPHLKLCPHVGTTISDLSVINITANNSADVVDIIGGLVEDNKHLPSSQLVIVLDKLEEVVNASQITSSLATDIVNIIENILQHGSDLPSVTNQILNITDAIGDKVLCNGSSHNIISPSLVLSLVNVNSSQFDGLTFGVSSFTQGLDPKIFINEELLNDTVAFISVPQEVEKFFPQEEGIQPRIQFQFYGTPDLFESQDPASGLGLYTHVVSASITNTTRDIRDLEHSVRVTLHHHTPNLHDDMVECVYWNFHSNGDQGGWDSTGCERNSTTVNHTTCLCNHLTHFAVLVDISRYKLRELDEKILSVISYLGCGISCVFLGISLLTYTVFEKLRRDYPSKILINLSLALLGLNLGFLVNSWLSSYGDGLCVAVAASLHYFTLASFTWMGLEAVHMYLALVKVFNVYVPSYIFKFCILGWGVPLVVVSTVLAVQQDAYGSKLYDETPGTPVNTERFCWVQHDVVFYVSVVTYVLLILVGNVSVFGLVLVQIRKMRVNKPAGTKKGLLQDLRSVASLTFLLGLTWMLAFFSWGPFKMPLFYLFSILNSLQGFFLFVFYCLMKENVRKQWRLHLCCGNFRPNEQSEWSRSVVAGGKSKANRMERTPSVKSDDSNETRRTSSSSNPGQQQPNNFRISLELVYEDGVALPHACVGSFPPPFGESSLSSTPRLRH